MGLIIFHRPRSMELDSSSTDKKGLVNELSQPGHEHALDKIMLSHFSKKPKSKAKKKLVKHVTPLLYIPNEMQPSLVTIDQKMFDSMLGKTHEKMKRQRKKPKKPDQSTTSVLQETSFQNSNMTFRLPPPEHVTVIKEVDVMPIKGDKFCPEEMVKCEICHVKFENRSRLALHMRVHRRCINTGSKRCRRPMINSSSLIAKYVKQNNLNQLTEDISLSAHSNDLVTDVRSKYDPFSSEASSLKGLEFHANVKGMTFERLNLLEIAKISGKGNLNKSTVINSSQTSLNSKPQNISVSYSPNTPTSESNQEISSETKSVILSNETLQSAPFDIYSHVTRSRISVETKDNTPDDELTGSGISVETKDNTPDDKLTGNRISVEKDGSNRIETGLMDHNDGELLENGHLEVDHLNRDRNDENKQETQNPDLEKGSFVNNGKVVHQKKNEKRLPDKINHCDIETNNGVLNANKEVFRTVNNRSEMLKENTIYEHQNMLRQDSDHLSMQSKNSESPENANISRNTLETNALLVLRKLSAQKSPLKTGTIPEQNILRMQENSNLGTNPENRCVMSLKGDNTLTQTFSPNDSPRQKIPIRGDNSNLGTQHDKTNAMSYKGDNCVSHTFSMNNSSIQKTCIRGDNSNLGTRHDKTNAMSYKGDNCVSHTFSMNNSSIQKTSIRGDNSSLHYKDSPCSRMIEFVRQIENVCKSKKCVTFNDFIQNDKLSNETDDLGLESHCSNRQPYLDDITFHGTTRYCGIHLHSQNKDNLVNVPVNEEELSANDFDFCSRVSSYSENMKHFKELKLGIDQNGVSAKPGSYSDNHCREPDNNDNATGQDQNLDENSSYATHPDNVNLKLHRRNLTDDKVSENLTNDDFVAKTSDEIQHGCISSISSNQECEHININSDNQVGSVNGENEFYHSDSDIFREGSPDSSPAMSSLDPFSKYRPPQKLLEDDSLVYPDQSVMNMDETSFSNFEAHESKPTCKSRIKEYIEQSSPDSLKSMIYLKDIHLDDVDEIKKKEITNENYSRGDNCENEKREMTERNELKGGNYSSNEQNRNQQNEIKNQETDEKHRRDVMNMQDGCKQKTFSVVKNLFDVFSSNYDEAEVNVYGRIMKSNQGQVVANHDSDSDSSDEDFDTTLEDFNDYDKHFNDQDNDKRFNDHDNDKQFNDQDNYKHPSYHDNDKHLCDLDNDQNSCNHDYDKHSNDIGNVSAEHDYDNCEVLLEKCSRLCSFHENMKRVMLSRKHTEINIKGCCHKKSSKCIVSSEINMADDEVKDKINSKNKSSVAPKAMKSKNAKKIGVTNYRETGRKRASKELKGDCSPCKYIKMNSQASKDCKTGKSEVKDKKRASKDRKTKVKQYGKNTEKQEKSKNSIIPRRSQRKHTKKKCTELKYDQQDFENQKSSLKKLNKDGKAQDIINEKRNRNVKLSESVDVSSLEIEREQASCRVLNGRRTEKFLQTASKIDISLKQKSPRKSLSPVKYKDYLTGSPKRNSPKKKCEFDVVSQSTDLEFVRKSPRKNHCRTTCALQCCLGVNSERTNQKEHVGVIDLVNSKSVNSNHGNRSNQMKSQGNSISKQVNLVGTIKGQDLKIKNERKKSSKKDASSSSKSPKRKKYQQETLGTNQKRKERGDLRTKRSKAAKDDFSNDKNPRTLDREKTFKEKQPSKSRKEKPKDKKNSKEKGERKKNENQFEKEKLMVKLFGSAFRKRRKCDKKVFDQTSDRSSNKETKKSKNSRSCDSLLGNESGKISKSCDFLAQNESRTIPKLDNSPHAFSPNDTKSSKTFELNKFKTPEKSLENYSCSNGGKLTTPKKRWTALFQSEKQLLEEDLENSDDNKTYESQTQENSSRGDNSPLNIDVLNVDMTMIELDPNSMNLSDSEGFITHKCHTEQEKCFWTSDLNVLNRSRKTDDSDSDECQSELHDGNSYTCARFIQYSRFCNSARTLPFNLK